MGKHKKRKAYRKVLKEWLEIISTILIILTALKELIG